MQNTDPWFLHLALNRTSEFFAKSVHVVSLETQGVDHQSPGREPHPTTSFEEVGIKSCSCLVTPCREREVPREDRECEEGGVNQE